MTRDVVIVGGVRTPLGKADGALAGMHAVDLGVAVVKELIARFPDAAERVDAFIMGNVIQPSEAANIARVIALKAGLDRGVPAHTVHRNCASGMQAVTDAAEKVRSGRAEVVIAGGVESMTHAPLLFHDAFRAALVRFRKAKAFEKRMWALVDVLRAPWKPRFSLLEGLTDPTIRLNMGQTAEVLAREFHISREDQDEFALESHRRAVSAWEEGWFEEEVLTLFPPPSFSPIHQDEGMRKGQSKEALAKLPPVFEKPLGTVTAGNSSQITDGACALLVSHREVAQAHGWPILGYLHDWDYAGCDPARMGLGPVFATHRLLQRMGLSLQDFDRIEINEAFAAQVLAVLKAAASKSFARKSLGIDRPLGEIPMEKLNVHGGAIAIGHPVGMTGARLILTLLRQLKKDCGGGLGLATLCVGGGQGGSVCVGSEPWTS